MVKWLKIVNPLLGLALGWVFFTVAVRKAAPDLMPREFFRNAHPLGGYAVFVLALIHLVLNWGWVKSAYFKKKKDQPASGK